MNFIKTKNRSISGDFVGEKKVVIKMDWLDYVMAVVAVVSGIAAMAFVVWEILESDLGRQFLRGRRQRKKERLLYELRKMGVKVVEADRLEKYCKKCESPYDEWATEIDIKDFLRFKYREKISDEDIKEIAKKIAKHYTRRRGAGDLLTLEELMYARLWFDGCYVSETKTDEE